MSKIQYEILEDGTITVTTDDLSGPNHVSADRLLKMLADTVGGETTIRKRSRLEVGHSMQHVLHEHTQDGHVH
ncbi:MAG: hypothetical protein WC378_00205 [Opitutaceae bacterium]|jgi:hypothetical protein